MKTETYAIRFNREKASAIDISKDEYERLEKELAENYKNVKASEMDEANELSSIHYSFKRYANENDLYARITLIKRIEEEYKK